MIELVNSTGDVIKVPSGARKVYEHQGFFPVQEAVVVSPAVVEVEELEEDEFAGLLEKPLGQWRKQEVISFAEAKNIDITGTKNINEAKAIIKEFLAEDSDDEWE